ncbi:MAG: BON domain-containing protein [Planctomycetaceae bacterium]
MTQQLLLQDLTTARNLPPSGRTTVPSRARADSQRQHVKVNRGQELAESVHRALQTMNDERLRLVSARIDDGEVVLGGHVRSYYARQLALHAVMSVSGVKRVIDELTVE